MKLAFKHALQEKKIPNLDRTERACLANPQFYLESTLNAIRSELIELENITGVSLQNPGVLHPARTAIDNARRAAALWVSNPPEADIHAATALRLQLLSLTEGYRTISGFYIIEARKTMEAVIFSQLEARLWDERHAKARNHFRLGEFDMKSRRFEGARDAFYQALCIAEIIRHTLGIV